MTTLPLQVLIASAAAATLIASQPSAAEPAPADGAMTAVPECDVIAVRVRDIVAEQLGASIEDVTPDASFVDDLGADSLDTVELVMAAEEEFQLAIPDQDAEKIHTVGKATEYLHERLKCKR